MPDTELAAAIRQAHVRTMFFAFILKGTDGKLLVSTDKIPPKEIEIAKKTLGGLTAVTGTFSGPVSYITFQVAKPPPAALAAMLGKVVKRDAELTIGAVVKVLAERPTR